MRTIVLNIIERSFYLSLDNTLKAYSKLSKICAGDPDSLFVYVKGMGKNPTITWIGPYIDDNQRHFPNPVAKPMETTTYSVIVKSNGGQIKTSSVTIEVIGKPDNSFVNTYHRLIQGIPNFDNDVAGIIKGLDCGYLMACQTSLENQDDPKYGMLIKTDCNGVVSLNNPLTWAKYFIRNYGESGTSSCMQGVNNWFDKISYDGVCGDINIFTKKVPKGYIITGPMQSETTGGINDMYCLKLDHVGEMYEKIILYPDLIGGTWEILGKEIQQNTDFDFINLGYGTVNGNEGILLAKLSNSLNLLKGKFLYSLALLSS